jgi:glycosyltransferase involved in cell wall biosynthesis
MKSITIDTRQIGNSGLGTYISNLIPYVIEYFQNLKFYLLIDPKYIDYYSSPLFKQKNVILIECTAKMYSLREQFELLKVIPKDTDIFWSPHYVVPIFYSKKTLVTIHDIFHLVAPESSLKSLYARIMFYVVISRASKIITDSNFSKQEIIRFTSAKPEIINVIHLGTDNFIRSSKQVTNGSSHSPYIVFIGNVKPNKNLLRLMKAFRKLIDVIPHRLLIVGKKEGLLSHDTEVFDYAIELGDRVEFTGFIDDLKLEQVLSHAKALVFPSIYEGFGLPPLEAMTHGCPVAAASAASIPEICGDSVLYFDPYNVDEIADKIYQLVTDSEFSRSLIEKGYERVKVFSWEECAKKTCKLIEELLVSQ